MKTLRFWQYINDGPVRLSLRDGERLAWASHCRHEEGWSSTYEAWERDGDYVYSETCDDGTDCDGRLTRESEARCHVSNLACREPYPRDDPMWAGIMLPEWEQVDSRQRDYAAEAMGY